MNKTKKPVSMDVIHILKSIVDYKTPALRAAVDAGRRAEQELPVLSQHISNLNQYILNNRYDRESTRDAESDLNDYEYQLSGIQTKINRGKSAQEQLMAAEKFNISYRAIVHAPAQPTVNLANLIAQRDEIYAQMCKIDDYIESCQINLNPSERNAEVVAQSQSDIVDYLTKYQDLSEKYDKLCIEIQSHTK